MEREAAKLPESHGEMERLEDLIEQNDVDAVWTFVYQRTPGVSGAQLHWLFEALLDRGDVGKIQQLFELYPGVWSDEYRERLTQKIQEQKGDPK